MKHFRFYVIAALAMLFLTGCSNDKSVISTGKIKNMLTTELEKEQANLMTSPLKIGYFECNSPEELNFYKKLEKLGIVTCEVQNFQWYTKVTRKTWHHDYTTEYYYEGTNELAYSKDHWGDGPVVTEYIPDYHNMINVQLTKKGQGMAFQPKEEKSTEPVYDPKDFPLDTLIVFTPEEMKEAPALPKPEIKKEYIVDKRKPAEPKKEKEVVTAPSPRHSSEAHTPAVKYPLYECMDPATKKAYEEAKEKENPEIVNIIICKIVVEEVKDRVIEKEEGEIVSMKATAVLKIVGVTEATHLIALVNNDNIILNNQKHEIEVSLVNNWVAGEIDKEEWTIDE